MALFGGLIVLAKAERGVELGAIDYVAFSDKPFLKFKRLLETYLASGPRGFRPFAMAMPWRLRCKRRSS
jgi:carbamoyltransferase